jgi:flagellar motor switch protein FliM
MPATLSPEEIKALMGAIQEGKVSTEGGGRPRGPVANYDLTSQDRIIRGQMPMLDGINEQIAQQLGIGLTGRTRLSIKAAASATTLLKFADLSPLLTAPASVCMLGLGPGFGLALAVLEPGLGEQLLGAALGDRRSREDEEATDTRREFTSVEQGVLKRLLGVFTDAIASAWEPVIPFKPEALRFEPDPRMANIAPPSEVGIISGFDLTGSIEGRLQLVIPYASVETAKQYLSSPSRVVQRGDKGAIASRQIARELEQVRVELRPLLGQTRINLSRLLGLEPGEVLLLDRDELNPIPILVQGREKMLGTPTVYGGAMSVKIERAVSALPPAGVNPPASR